MCGPKGSGVNRTVAHAWVVEINRLIQQNKQYLTQLDSAIGDADHGINLSRGFTAVTAAVEQKDPATPGELLTLVGGTLISTVGGASGPLYGTAFRRAGKALGKEPEVSPEAFGNALKEAVTGVQALGAAAPGDKTMVDAFIPATEAFQAAVAEGKSFAEAASLAAAAASEGATATIPLLALKGRASYLGARSVGHQDPGATSTALVFQALVTALS
jgi:dihydroxyacetone kinase-like protein